MFSINVQKQSIQNAEQLFGISPKYYSVYKNRIFRLLFRYIFKKAAKFMDFVQPNQTTDQFGSKFIEKLQIYEDQYACFSLIRYFWNIPCCISVDFQKVYRIVQYFNLLTEIQSLARYLKTYQNTKGNSQVSSIKYYRIKYRISAPTKKKMQQLRLIDENAN